MKIRNNSLFFNVFLACAAVAGVALAVDVPPSGSVNLDFVTAPGGDWTKADIGGAAGDVNSVATMNTKVASPGPGAFGAIPSTAYANSVNWGYAGRTLFATPASVAAAGMRVAVTNKTGASVTGLTINYTLCVPYNNIGVAESPRGFVVYYTTNQTGVGNWTYVNNHVPPADSLGSKTNITFTVSPAAGWANNAPLYVMWADDNASGNDVCYAVSNFTFTAVATAAGGFTAYNDCVYSATADDLNNAPNVTRYALNSSYPTSGPLTNQADGATTPVVVTLVANNGTPSFSTGGGTNCLAGTDAGTIFRGIAGLRGTEGLPAGSPTASVDLIFTNLNPDKAYVFATTANRGCTIADGGTPALWVTNRWTKFTLSGVTNCVNASSIGANVIFNSPTNSAVSFSTGENTFNGYVARWSGIRCDASGSFRVRADNEGLNGHSNVACYGFSAFMLKEGSAINLPPTVSITNPVNWGAVTIGSSVSVAATAADDAQVTSVSFYLDGVLLGSSVTSPYGATWPNATMGVHTLKAVAWDNTGLATTSAVVTVSVVRQPGYGGLQLDGVNDSVTMGSATSLGAATFTLECWMRKLGSGLTSTSGNGGIVAVPLITKGRGEAENSNVDCNYFFGILPSGALAADFEQFYADGGMAAGQNYPVTGTSTAAGDGAWHHAAVTYDGSNWVLYLDGAVDRTLNIGLHTPRFDSIQHAGLGVAMNSGGVTEGAFQGVMDEVRIWNFARTQAQIAGAMFNEVVSAPGLIGRWSLNEISGTVATNSGSASVNGTLVNGPVWTTGYPLQSAGNQPPAVAIASPANGATVSSSFTIQATATDDGDVTNVEFYADGALLGNDTFAPYNWTWDSAALGSHTLTAVAWDDSGLAATSVVVNVTTIAPNLPPTVTSLVPANGAANVPVSTMLQATVSDPEGANLSVSFYGRPAGALTTAGADFTIAVLPDTQYYSQDYPWIFTNQTAWIVANRTSRNITYVSHLGDVTDDADSMMYQWTNAASAMHLLEDPGTTGLPDGMPYGIAPGNHDHVGGTVGYNQYFGVSHFTGKPWYGGHMGSDNQNHYDLISAGGLDFIILYTDWNYASLSYPPIDAWANSVLQAYPNRRAIIVRHGLLESSGAWADDGVNLLNTVKTNANVFLLMNGHSAGERQYTEYVNGRRVDVLCADYQNYPNGGNGYLRLYEFSPSNNVIHVRTYSTTLGLYETDANSQFDIPYPMSGTPAPFQLLGTFNNVPSGATVACAWAGLAFGSNYEWYVVAADGTNAFTGATNLFTTALPPPVPVVTTSTPYVGVTMTARTDVSPRPLKINVVDIDLTAPGLRFKLTPQSGWLDTTTEPVLQYMNGQHAQLAVNSHFFTPWPMTNTDHAANLVGIAASEGNVYSPFEENPPSPHAIHTNAPGLNITADNQASIVHRGTNAYTVAEAGTLWNTLSGSEQIVSNGVVIAANNTWNNTLNPRTIIGLAPGNHLVIVVIDGRQTGVSEGMTIAEAAAMLVNDYGVTEALNLDGGGSSTLAMDAPTPHIVNTPSDNPPRSVGSSLAIFATPVGYINQLPVVTITSPADGSIVATNFTITATATDDSSVTNVAFYADGSLLGNEADAPYSFVWNAAPIGTHVLTAVAWDNDGLTATSAVVNITVAPPAVTAIDFSENFDSMGTGTISPAGWSFLNQASGSPNDKTLWTGANLIVQTGVTMNPVTPLTRNDAPTANNNNGYNALGASGQAGDRCIASAPTSIASLGIQAPSLTNNTGSAIDAINLSYDIKRFTAGSVADELLGFWLFYSVDGGTTWYNVTALNPTVANLPNTVGLTTIAATNLVLSAPWASGGTLLLRWVDDNGIPSPDQIIGLDNVHLTTEGGSSTPTPPTVAITSPANNANTGTSITIAANATDDGTVTNVVFYTDGSLLGNDVTAPFRLTWDSASEGSHALTAVAWDNDGLSATSAVVNVTVLAGQAPAIRNDSGTAMSNVAAQVVANGAIWKYLDNGSDQGTAWLASAFDDSAWAGGAAPLGYGDSWIVTTVFSPAAPNRYITTYLRRHFTASAGVTWTNIALNLMRDDGVVIYLNGVELLRDNMPTGLINYLTWSSTIVGGADETTYFPFNYNASGVIAGDNVLAVELHQRDGTSSDLTFDLGVTLQGSTTGGVSAVSNVTAHSAVLLGEVTADGGQTPNVSVYYGTTDGGTDTNLWQRSLDLGAQPVGKVSGTVIDLAANTTYFFRYRARNDYGSVWADASASFATLAAPAPVNQSPATPVVVVPANGATGVSQSPALTVSVSDPEGSALSVAFYGRVPGASAPVAPDFALVVLPDTQNYSTSYPQIFRSQTDWIVSNRLSRNIAYVAGVGDIVNNAGSVAEYRNATNALYRLEDPITTGLPDGIPYGTCVGNHDMPTTLYNQYFGTNHFAGKSYYGGNYGSNNDSHYDLFSAGGMDFVVLYITMGGGGDSSIITWGNSVLQTYANRRAIVIEHSILNVTTRPTPSTWTGEGQPLFNALKGNTNLFLMLCGHMHGEGFRREVLPDGRVIDIVLADYQDYPPNGGDGNLRIMTFSPSNNQIRVTTYSTSTGVSRTGPDSQFNLDYAMAVPSAPFVALGTNTGVASGAQTARVWSDLTTNTTYEWYTVASDGTNSASSAVVSFKTLSGSLPPMVTTTPWKFGVMSDTQWTGVPADPINNPNDVAVSIINQLNPQFIAAGVKFVVQVGDLTESGQPADLAVRAAAAQLLYNAGIGFFPLRGNHETSQPGAWAFTNNFPQTQGFGSNVVGATLLGSPDPSGNGNLRGLSYAFDYNNARLVLLDQFTRLSGVSPSVDNAIVDQIPWIGTTLSNRASGTHGFVFAHKNLIGQDHADVMFGANAAANPAAQNAFLGVCDQTDVGYVLGGHDHIHQRSRIASPDGLSSVRSIICASDSSKFYTPAVPSRDQTYNSPRRETSVAQDLYRIGYYIFTVDGPLVTAEYYASDETFPSGNSTVPTPTLHFQKRETFGYSLNGNEYAVPQGNAYTNVRSSIASGSGFLGTSAAILDGTNASTLKDGSGRALVKTVTTGWQPATNTASDMLTLWGMTDLAAAQADTYVLSLSYDPAGLTDLELQSGEFALATRNAFGRWVLAVEQNIGGQRQFVFGPWNSSYTLGTYGVDTSAGTVWAVLNYTATFAASQVQIASPGYVAGDFHQHTLHTDGSLQMADVFAKDALYGLSWWADSEHGGSFRSDYRWKDIGGYAIPSGLADHSWGEVKAGRLAHPAKTVIQGLELNCPGHEHVSTAIIADQFPAGTNLAPIAEFEYRFDGGDGDTSGGPGGLWTGKSTVNNHAKATNAVAWLQANYPAKSWFVPAHPERANSYTIAHFRDFNNVGPDVAFGFESMPGHQKSGGRGGYATSAGVPPAPSGQGGTFGGTGIYAAQVGGLWDAMLAEGRGWWLFANSDFHNTGGDFWPGEYQKTYTYVPDTQQANSAEAAQLVADGLRSGNSWVVEGDLIDSLTFSVSNAVMGQTCTVPQGAQVTVSIRVHDPVGTNYNSYSSYNNPALDHIDVIAGTLSSKIAPFLGDGITPNPAYSAINSDARVIARFDAVGGVTDANGITSVQWTDQGDGWRQMTLSVTVTNATFLRLRGANLGINVVNQTDGAGNPLADSLLGVNTAAMAFDDLWFYSNPVFVRNPAPNIAPTVSLSSPTDGGEFVQGVTIPVLASATDADGSIAQVNFYADGTLLGSDTTYTYQYNWTTAPTGTHALVAVAIDNQGQATTSSVVSITVVASVTEGGSGLDTPALRFRVLAGTDDAEENKANGAMDLTSSDLELIQDGSKNQLVGMRFANVVIPQGARIVSAYVQFTCDEMGTKNINPFSVTIRGEATNSAAVYTTTPFNMSSRARTTATVAWSNAPDWQIEHEAGAAQRTPDISAVVQEIVSRPGWAEGNALALVMEGQGGRCAEAFEGEPTKTPELVVVVVRETSVAVTAGTDDAEENKANGAMDLASSDLELIQDGSKNQLVGMRFNSVNIPRGTKILSAYLQFTCDEMGSKNINPFSVTIRGEATNSAASYTTTASNMSSRARTAATVAWSNAQDWQIEHEAGAAQRTPDISAVVQEIVSRGDWAEGNSLALMIEGQGGRCAEAFEGEPTMTPRLVIQTPVTKEASFGPAASSDDAEENNASGAMDLTSSDIEVIQDGSKNQTVGIRCPNVTLPAGALLVDAYLQFTCDEMGSKNINPFSVTIRGEATDNAAAFTTTASNIAVRARTTAAAAWSNAPDWQIEHEAGPAQRTPSVRGIVSEILARPGWANGNAMVFLINGQGGRCAEAYDGEPTMPPKLVLVYAGGSAVPVNTPPTVTLTSPLNGAVVDEGQPIALSATASDNSAVSNVAFYVDGAPVANDATAPYTATWTAAIAGSHTLTAVAWDDAGLAATSATVNITVTLPTPSISFGVTGTAVQTLSTLPSAMQWATASVGLDKYTYTTGSQLDAAVQTLAASAVAGTLVSDTVALPARNGLAVWSSYNSGFMQTCPTSIGATLLKATLVNQSGTNLSFLRLSYQYTVVANVVEDIPGQHVFYSLTGAPGSWTLIPALSGVVASTNLDVTVALSSPWTNGATLYLLWADDNDTAFSPDTYFQLDNFVATPGVPPVPFRVALTAPTTGAMFAQGHVVTLAATASGEGLATNVNFYVDGGLVGSDATAPYTTTWTAATTGSHTLTAVAQDAAGQTTTSAVVTVKITLPVSTAPWKFGVMSDTQWTGVPADPINNPNDVAVSIINQINPQFINAGVQFVVQVGDLTESGQPADVTVRAAAATDLYNAGIGFFPLRGNHESSQAAARQVTNDFPQTQGLGANVYAATNFTSASGALAGLSYAFDYNNSRMVLLDQFTRLDGTGADVNNAMVDQVPWIGTTLSNRLAGTHAFVFSHKNLIGENHVDSLFGANPAANTNAQNQFIGALQNTGVRYALSGHDHVYQRSLIASPDVRSSVEEIICGSDSSKFYTPGALSSFAGQKPRETSLAQDLYRITYYVGTVDGPRFSMDYYASDETFPSGNSPAVTPTLHFNKRETFGYSLNGRRFLVPQGGSYTTVVDSVAAGTAYGETYRGTTARILAGVNGSTNKDYNGRGYTREINTGWAPASTHASDILTLWGLSDLGTNQTDVFVLSMSYDPGTISMSTIQSGRFGLLLRDFGMEYWHNAADLNVGGVQNFVLGPWNSSYPLGTGGVDTNTHTAWVVINRGGDFCVATLRHPSVCAVQVLTSGSGTVTPASTNVTYLGSAVIAATADPYRFIRDIQTNGASIGGTFGMTATNYTWSTIAADSTALVIFDDVSVTSPTPVGATATPLWWLDQHGLTNGYSSFEDAARADQDHDGFANWQEYMVGMNPHGSNEVETITSMDMSGVPVSGGGDDVMQLVWPSLPGLNYTVEHSDNLDDLYGGHGDQTEAQPGIGTTNTCTVTVPVGTRHFFRLKAEAGP